MVMHQSDVDLGIRPCLQVFEGCEVAVVASREWDRQMDPVEWTNQMACDLVRQLNDESRVRRLFEVLMTPVSVTEVVPELHRRGHGLAKLHQPLRDLLPRTLQMRRRDGAFEDCNFGRDVPLNRELSVRNLGEDLLQLLQQAPSVSWLDLRPVTERHEGRDRSQWRREAHLEPYARRNNTSALQCLKPTI